MYDKNGKPDLNCPLLDAIRMHLATRQNQGMRILGKGLNEVFNAPPYGLMP